MRRYVIIVLGAIILVAGGLSLFAVFGILTAGEVLSAIILVGLVAVTIYYATETRSIAKATHEQARATQEQARESGRARLGSLHPILSIVSEMEVIEGGLPQQNWLQRRNPMMHNNIRIMNLGPGPALRGMLSVYAGANTIQVSNLPPLASGWGHTAEISAINNYSDVTLLRLSYEDVFGYKHETSFKVKFTDSMTLKVEDESHECFYVV